MAGNHEDKLLRKLRGRNVTVSHGLAETLAQLDAAAGRPAWPRCRPSSTRSSRTTSSTAAGWSSPTPGSRRQYQGRASGRVRGFCLYGDTTGETDEYGLPVRYPWARDYRGSATVVYGHTPTPGPGMGQQHDLRGHRLRLRRNADRAALPERELVSVPAAAVYYEPARPLAPATPPRAPGLSIADVTGRRSIDTGYGRVTVAAENAAAALEVMGRFAIDPSSCCGCRRRWRPAPPPLWTATSSIRSRRWPTTARVGLDRVVLQEKHMGSRAVVLARGDGTGVCYTRTGRAFFTDGRLGDALVSRVAAAAGPLFDELDSDWVLLDCELLPVVGQGEPG